jgi:co-chaperonin GroES (HSP10)
MNDLRREYRYDGEDMKASFDVCTKKASHGINPKGARVLVLPDEVETKTKSGIITATGTAALREELAQVDGIVVAMGNTCYHDQPEPFCKVGDKVIFGKYSGIIREGNDGKKYRIINDLDVVGTIDEGYTNE